MDLATSAAVVFKNGRFLKLHTFLKVSYNDSKCNASLLVGVILIKLLQTIYNGTSFHLP